MGIDRALTALSQGDPVLVYDADDREAEVDMIVAAEHVDHETVAWLRNDAGGLVCTAIPHDAAERLELPFLADTIDHPSVEQAEQAYGDRSSFSLWVNHADTYTGITDRDRATTITALVGHVDADTTPQEFANDFTSPGHVAVLRAADGLMDARQGHTEMGVYVMQQAGLAPVAVVCEMLDDTTGDALSKADARAYADDNGLVFLAGEQVVRHATNGRCTQSQ